ncbi:hypothetical protein D3C72_1233370 [compost metagenome]
MPDKLYPCEADHRADCGATCGQKDEFTECVCCAERTASRSRYGKTKEYESTGVIQEAFSFQKDMEASRNLHPFEHGPCRNCVGR